MITLDPAIPIIRIFSIEKVDEFYLSYLGFVQDWAHRFGADAPLYMQISRSGLKLHLSEHHGDAAPGATVFVTMTGIEALAAELHAKAYSYARPAIEHVPWGRVLEVPDPFGNRLRFCEPKAAAPG